MAGLFLLINLISIKLYSANVLSIKIIGDKFGACCRIKLVILYAITMYRITTILIIKTRVKIKLVLWNRRHHPINHQIIKIINRIVSNTVTQTIII